MQVLTTGDLALTLCSPEPPILTELRDWLVATMPMVDAVQGLPEEQGRVLATLVRALDARRILDLGTFTGYSSIAMALAAADDAKVTCCEPQRRRAAASARPPARRLRPPASAPSACRRLGGVDGAPNAPQVRERRARLVA